MNESKKNLIWNNNQIKWFDLINPTKEELSEYSGFFNIDSHFLSDCLEPNHLPKIEKLQNYTFIILRTNDNQETKFPVTIQGISNKIAIFFDENTIITIHRVPINFIEEIKSKYLETGLIKGSTEIVTKLMLFVIKSFEPNALYLSEKIDKLEKHIFFEKQEKNTLEDLYYLKNSCRLNKNIIGLTQYVIMQHKTSEDDISAVNDVKDLIVKLTHSFEETHDDATNLSNIYISILSQKTNSVMKLLTIFSVFFMPLTFIAGIYGMNFYFMPELSLEYGYPLVLFVMLIIVILIFIWFKRKKIF